MPKQLKFPEIPKTGMMHQSAQTNNKSLESTSQFTNLKGLKPFKNQNLSTSGELLDNWLTGFQIPNVKRP